MKRLITVLILLLFVRIVFSQTQTTLTDLGRLSAHTTVTPNVYNGSAVSGTYYYTAGDGKVYIYKMTDPKNPTYIKTIPSLTNAQRAWTGENYLFVYTGTAIKIYDLTDHENPLFKANYTAGSDLHKVSAKGIYMFVLYMYDGSMNKNGSFEIVDITDATNPILKGTYLPNSSEGRSFFFSETANRVYVAHYNFSTNDGHIREIDYSVPTNPTQIRELVITGAPIEISISGTTMFILKDGGWQGPSKLEAYDLGATPIAQLASLQVSTGRAWDMHAYGNSITVTLLETNGFKNYTWNATTKVFENGLDLNIPNASQISWYMVSTQGSGSIETLRKTLGGYWIYFYYYVLEKSPSSMESDTYGYYVRLVEVKIWIEVPAVKVTLITSVNPAEASADGSTVTPSGSNQYDKNSTIPLLATAGSGWVFANWSGSLSGSQNPQDLKMDNDKNVVGNFQPILTLSLSSPADDYLCSPGPNEELTIATAGIFVDGVDWMLSGISFGVVESFKPDYTEAWIEYSGTKLKGTINSDANGNATSISFSPSRQITEGTTLSVRLFYKFNYPSTSTEKYIPAALTEVKKYKVSIRVGQVICEPIPVSARPGVKGPPYPPNIFYSNTQTVASVWNVSKDPNIPFTSIQDAINSSSTVDGNIIELCPGLFKENVNVTKSLTIRSKQGKDATKVIALTSNDHIFDITSDNVTIDGLSIKGSTQKAGVFVEGNQVKNVFIKNARITENGWRGIEGKDLQLVLENVTIDNNRGYGVTGKDIIFNGTENLVADNDSVGIYAVNSLIIENIVITGNKRQGVLSKGQILIKKKSIINNNATETDPTKELAGAVEVFGKIEATDLEMKYNNGYGILLNGFGNVILNNSKIEHNKSYGIHAFQASVTLTNVYINDNSFTGVWGDKIIINGIDNQINKNEIGISASTSLTIEAARVDSNKKQGIYSKGPVNFLKKSIVSYNALETDPTKVLAGAIEVSERIEATDLEVSHNGGYGILFNGTGNVILNNSQVEYNKSYGIHAFQAYLNLRDVKVNHNDYTGIWGERIKIDGIFNQVNYNEFGISAWGWLEIQSIEVSYNKNSGIFCKGPVRIFGTSKVNYNASKVDPQKVLVAGIEASGEIWATSLEVVGNNGFGIYLNGYGTVNISSPKISNNVLTGIHAYESSAILNNVIILANKNGIVAKRLDIIKGIIALNKEWGVIIERGTINQNMVIIDQNGLGGIFFRNSSLHKTVNVFNDDASLIRNSNISDNSGDGIRFEISTPLIIQNNSIYNNSGFGINNLVSSINLNASGNWWGSNNGPSGNSISGNVLVGNWLSTPVSLVVSSIKDTVYVANNSLTDSTTIFINNYSRTTDNINVTISEQFNWIISQKNFSVIQNDSTGVSSKIKFIIPSPPQSSINKIKITAVSAINSSQTAKDSFYVRLYTPALVRIKVLPDSVKIEPGENFTFSVNGFDQSNSLFIFTPTWSATGGTIDQIGKYTAGSTRAIYRVTASNSSGTVKGEAIVNVGIIVGIKGEKIPTEFSLLQNYPNPFNPTTRINYSIPQTSRVRITIYNILGQVVKELVDEEKLPGNYILNWDATKNASGIYICRIIASGSTKTYVKSVKMILLK